MNAFFVPLSFPIMPLTQIPPDVSLHVLSFLPLGTLATLLPLNKVWKRLVETNAPEVYRNAAVLHGCISKPDVSLRDAIAALDCEVPDIHGWMESVRRLCLDVEKNWAGLGRSRLRKSVRSLPDASSIMEIEDSRFLVPTSDSELPPILRFAYDQGYLVLVALNQASKAVLEVWHEASIHPTASDPTSDQADTAISISERYGVPTTGHFLPCLSLSLPKLAEPSVKLLFPTLVVASRQVHVWDLSTGAYLWELNHHEMGEWTLGIDISHEYILVFNFTQICVFSRHDGSFLFNFLDSLQLHAIPAGISECGTICVAVSANNRVLLICNFNRLVAGDVPFELVDAAIEIKLGKEYGSPIPGGRSMSKVLAVTWNRIALSTTNAVVVINLPLPPRRPQPTLKTGPRCRVSLHLSCDLSSAHTHATSPFIARNFSSGGAANMSIGPTTHPSVSLLQQRDSSHDEEEDEDNDGSLPHLQDIPAESDDVSADEEDNADEGEHRRLRQVYANPDREPEEAWGEIDTNLDLEAESLNLAAPEFQSPPDSDSEGDEFAAQIRMMESKTVLGRESTQTGDSSLPLLDVNTPVRIPRPPNPFLLFRDPFARRERVSSLSAFVIDMTWGQGQSKIETGLFTWET
ncbi:hypothetical protein FB45DRAFT_1084440 [Roridomyces roridus]|uniref:F-box domain-containing protein n=1 Tax=Roridomyces roridus TaxID=1738132 RepID=A0AAD7FLI7_9AGAR|nr:hypothetical protein FB45DRAFT_1084440 [Roridomyces roridus]